MGVIGDGSANYGITALWTAAQHQVPLTVVLLRNGTYGALRWLRRSARCAGRAGPGRIPGLDFTRIAQGHGVPARHVDGVEELRAVLARTPPTAPGSSRSTRHSPRRP
ncbi:thiamine pyrophosphate-dependent enzyme [Streptomyces tricolor]|nr:thiamine pyrophosphate-dependent enzyme [Streptomyces tricolor]